MSGESADPCVEMASNAKGLRLETPQGPRQYTFDHVFGTESEQTQLFSSLGLPLIESCLEGFNGTIFAYGQTGAGKTFTMTGPENPHKPSVHSSSRISDFRVDPGTSLLDPTVKGLIPRMIEHLFSRISDITSGSESESTVVKVHCSFLEIYKEKLYDLLRGGAHEAGRFRRPGDAPLEALTLREYGSIIPTRGGSQSRGRAKTRRDARLNGVHVGGLTRRRCETFQDALKYLAQGVAFRRMGSTRMNSVSSRSHSVFTLEIEQKKRDSITTVRRSKLHLIDLAGSERQVYTQSQGLTLQEACSINQSLSCLGKVIMALAERAKGNRVHIHYRDSKLTFLLKDSLGGNSKTVVIANVSPSFSQASETWSTLNFARGAKKIKNLPLVNEKFRGDPEVMQTIIDRLTQENAKLRGALRDGAGIPQSVADDRTVVSDSKLFKLLQRILEIEEKERSEMESRVVELEKLCAAKEAASNVFRMAYKIRECQLAKCEGREPALSFYMSNPAFRADPGPDFQVDPARVERDFPSVLNRFERNVRMLMHPERHPRVIQLGADNANLMLRLQKLQSEDIMSSGSVDRGYEYWRQLNSNLRGQGVARLRRVFDECQPDVRLQAAQKHGEELANEVKAAQKHGEELRSEVESLRQQLAERGSTAEDSSRSVSRGAVPSNCVSCRRYKKLAHKYKTLCQKRGQRIEELNGECAAFADEYGQRKLLEQNVRRRRRR